MKKSLFQTSLICGIVVLSACSHRKPIEDLSLTEDTGTEVTGDLQVDTTHTSGQTETSGTAGEQNGTLKDTTKVTGTPRAIYHGSEDQQKLDSIKAAKLKLKHSD